MTEMIEKVKQALKRCIYDPDPGQPTKEFLSCSSCPYQQGCTHDLMRDALALLKEQEPRVMTLEEVKRWCETHPHKQNPIWVEFQHGYGDDGWRIGLVNSGMLAWCKDNEARCWTSRPSPEQIRDTPWEAGNETV